MTQDVFFYREKGIMRIGIILSLLASFSYLMCYIYLPLVTIFSLFFLVVFYYGLITYQRIEFYFFSLLVYRPFIELMFPFKGGMSLGILFIVYLPILYFGLIRPRFNLRFLNQHKFLILYLLFSFISGAYFHTFSMYIYQNRYGSLVLFLYFGIVYRKEIDYRLWLLLFRIIFSTCLIVYFFPNYTVQTNWLMGDYGIFGDPIPVEETSYVIPRNGGFYFDCRLLGLLSIIYYIISLLFKDNKYRKIDIMLSLVILLTSTSRGAMLLGIFVYLGYVLEKKRISIKSLLKYCVSGCAVFLLLTMLSLFIKPIAEFINTFNPFNETGAVAQRMIYIGYGVTRFLESPLIGIGAGALKGNELFDWGELFVGGEYYHKETYITDSFLTSTLAEVGIIGFILFLIYQKEIFYNKSIFSIMLMMGLFSQMFGTDIPDIGIQYMVILFLCKSVINNPQSISYRA